MGISTITILEISTSWTGSVCSSRWRRRQCHHGNVLHVEEWSREKISTVQDVVITGRNVRTRAMEIKVEAGIGKDPKPRPLREGEEGRGASLFTDALQRKIPPRRRGKEKVQGRRRMVEAKELPKGKEALASLSPHPLPTTRLSLRSALGFRKVALAQKRHSNRIRPIRHPRHRPAPVQPTTS